jgi:hypothetical protein
MTRLTKSEGAKARNVVRTKLQRIRDNHELKHKGSILECPRCMKAWKALETDVEHVRRKHKGQRS